MPKNNNKKTAPAKKIVTAAKRAVVKTVTEARNTAIPKLKPAKKLAALELTQDQIARRAYEIYASGNGGSDTDNWFRAERELRGGI
jgi:hypothetical protein